MSCRFLLVALLFLAPLLSRSQLDQNKLDSLSRAIDSSGRISRLSIDSMKQVLDSLMKTPTPDSTVAKEATPSGNLAGGSEHAAAFWTLTGIIALGFIVLLVKFGVKAREGRQDQY